MLNKDTDYYGVLRLDPSADMTMVEHAYWHLARALQAAANTDPSAYGRLQELNEAYSVLGTPALRAEYDRACPSGPSKPNTKRNPSVSILRPLLLVAGITLAPVRALRRLLAVAASARSCAVAFLTRQRRPRAATRFPRVTHRGKPAIDSTDLRASTANTIARWRKRAEAAPPLRPEATSEEAVPPSDNPDDSPP